MKTDCDPSNGLEGIDKLAEAIRREIEGLKDVHAKFPASWFAIKDALAGMKENFMSLDRYRELCRKHNEDDAKAQDDLAGYLHCLGIALNYRDDPRLRDTSILNPHWVTTGIGCPSPPRICCPKRDVRFAKCGYKLLNADKLAREIVWEAGCVWVKVSATSCKFGTRGGTRPYRGFGGMMSAGVAAEVQDVLRVPNDEAEREEVQIA